jgi:hypothetical protein
MNTRHVILAVVGISALALTVLGGEIYQHYQKQPRAKPARYQHSAVTNHSITEIGIERLGCYGKCPVYTLVISSDGSVRYEGTRHVPRTGKRDGYIDRWHFNLLAEHIRESGFFELEDSYSRDITDSETVLTSVVRNGKRKIISNYANSGPIKLWGTQQLIDSLLSKVIWIDEEIERLEKKKQ